jgi:hypothetical protein
MVSSYRPVDPIPGENCFYCCDPLDKDVVAHGNLHPVHEKCIATWAKSHPNCPVCREKIDPLSLPSARAAVLQNKQVIHNIGQFGLLTGLSTLSLLATNHVYLGTVTALGASVFLIASEKHNLINHPRFSTLMNRSLLGVAGVVSMLALGNIS